MTARKGAFGADDDEQEPPNHGICDLHTGGHLIGLAYCLDMLGGVIFVFCVDL